MSFVRVIPAARMFAPLAASVDDVRKLSADEVQAWLTSIDNQTHTQRRGS